MNCLYFFSIALFVLILQPAFGQTTKDTLILKDQVNKLQVDLEEQKSITSNLLQRINDLIENQNNLIKQFTQTTLIIQGLQSSTTSNKQQEKFKDAFILNREGKPIAFIDYDLKLYDYYGKDFIGWIKPETNEIYRNFDESAVAIIENDFLLDETGHVVGSIERSENLKKDRFHIILSDLKILNSSIKLLLDLATGLQKN